MLCANCQHDLGDTSQRDAFIAVEIAGDEYIFSYWRCDACGYYTLETYHGRFSGSEEITAGDPIPANEGDAIVALIEQCPTPSNKRCSCPVHQKIVGASDASSSTADAPISPSERTQGGRNEVLIPCPNCSKPTPNLKRYGVMKDVLFVGIAARSRRCAYTACPKCMRSMVLRDTFKPLNILLANLMWILVVLPYCLGIMLVSRIPGHSAIIRKQLWLDA